MADNIVDITFTDVRLGEMGDPSVVATITGTIAVDYTTDTVSGSLTAAVPGTPPSSIVFTQFQLAQTTSPYAVDGTHGSDTLDISYSGTQPTSLASASLFVHVGSITYDFLVSNVLTPTPCYRRHADPHGAVRHAGRNAPGRRPCPDKLGRTSPGQVARPSRHRLPRPRQSAPRASDPNR